MFEFYLHRISDSRQRPINSIEQGFLGYIILWPNPFAFQYPPQRFGNVQMGRIWRQIKEEEPTAFPKFTQFFYFFIPVHTGIIQNNDCILLYPEREAIEKVNNLICVNAFSGRESFISVITVYHSEDIDSLCLLGREIDILITKLPAIRNIAFGTDMTFIGKEKIDLAIYFQTFKFLQLLGLVLIELRRGNSPWAFSYSLISCANADKKRLKVQSLASFPVAFCQASRALLTHCLSCSIALRTTASSEQSMIGLRPRPGRVYRPAMPNSSKRFTQELTEICDISVCNPISWLEREVAFKSTARQRIRKQWVSPLRKPSSKDRRCASVNWRSLILPITLFLMKLGQSC